MPRRIRLISVFLFSVLVALVLLQGRPAAICSGATLEQEPADSALDLISVLDGCIQHRFEDIDKSFGFRRIVKAGETPHRFKPENAREFDVVHQLEKYQVGVALYLAGRAVLGPEPDKAQWEKMSGGMIKGPVSITTTDHQAGDLPKSSELWEQARRAMVSFQTSDTYDFTMKGWRYAARPVRAIESCLHCHGNTPGRMATPTAIQQPKSLKVGDPLGVILYAYKHSD